MQSKRTLPLTVCGTNLRKKIDKRRSMQLICVPRLRRRTLFSCRILLRNLYLVSGGEYIYIYMCIYELLEIKATLASLRPMIRPKKSYCQ